jgi:hypothetical protein
MIAKLLTAATVSDNGSLDIVQLFNFEKKELGVVLALLEKGPAIVPKIIAQLDASGGSTGRAVKMWYEQAKAELDTVP